MVVLMLVGVLVVLVVLVLLVVVVMVVMVVVDVVVGVVVLIVVATSCPLPYLTCQPNLLTIHSLMFHNLCQIVTFC